MTNKENELLPCPFCGGEAIQQNDAELGDMYFKEWVSCAGCGARMIEDKIDCTKTAGQQIQTWTRTAIFTGRLRRNNG